MSMTEEQLEQLRKKIRETLPIEDYFDSDDLSGEDKDSNSVIVSEDGTDGKNYNSK